MYRLSAKLEISSDKDWQLDKVTEVEITRDTEQLTDTCKITLPKKIRWNGLYEVPLKRGDAVKVWLGYNDNLSLAFVGYIRDVGLKTPVILSCEDEMFQLKQQETVKKAYTAVTIEQLLKDQGLTSINVLGEQALGAYRVTANTVAALLSQLKDNGIRSFYRYENDAPVLYCGVIFERDADIAQVFATGINIIDDSNLKQQQADNMRLRVRAVSLMPDNSKYKVEVGDDDGELRTIHTYNKNESELKAWAEQELERLKQDGLTGSFTTFGHCLIDKLDAIGIKIDDQKKGIYQVRKNVIKYGTAGFHQEITLGGKISS